MALNIVLVRVYKTGKRTGDEKVVKKWLRSGYDVERRVNDEV